MSAPGEAAFRRPEPRRSPPIFAALMGQAFWLAVGYVGLGVLVDAMRRLMEWEFWNQASRFIDALALSLLRRAGLVEWVIDVVAQGRGGAFATRVLLSAVTVAAIFAQAALLAAVFATIARLARR